MWRKTTLLHRWWKCKLVESLEVSLKIKNKNKLKIELPYDPAISLLGTYPEKIII